MAQYSKHMNPSFAVKLRWWRELTGMRKEAGELSGDEPEVLFRIIV